MSVLPDSVSAWRDRGFFFEVSGRRHFAIDSGPDGADTCVLVLHGFPSSSYDFRPVWDDLTGREGSRRRVIAFDALGFGLSDKPPHAPYSLFDVADVAEVLLRERGVRHAHVVAHDMGTSVLAELLARRERGLATVELRSLLFTNGSIFVEMTRLTRSQKLLLSPLAETFSRLSRFSLFKAQLDTILGRPLRDPDEYVAMWELMRHLDGHLRLPQTIGYVRERRRYQARWIPPLSRVDLPTRVLWGPLDGVAVMPIGERLARTIPGAELVRLEGLGHYPMLEDPGATGRAMSEWLDACFRGEA